MVLWETVSDFAVLDREGHHTIGEPSRIDLKPGLSEVQTTIEEAELPVIAEKRGLVCK